jgi:ketosteroid isomerase-like protein
MSGVVFERDEVEAAFAHFYELGCVDEDWTGWADLFTDDCEYVEHFWGTMRGRDEVRAWIDPVMAGVPEIYTVLEWYAIDGDKVVWSLQNRRDNPDPDGPPYFDFPGISVAWYAGDGRWAGEEDYWDVKGARATAQAYAAACAKTGLAWDERLTRKHWGDGPDWARTNRPPAPSWLGRTDITPITKPAELRALIPRLAG